ncbi:MAG: S8 family serine peptidase, partial [Sphingobacteriales bacterium]|nr:S8 family serine peptidase [Sphingobacteriales bacterium]
MKNLSSLILLFVFSFLFSTITFAQRGDNTIQFAHGTLNIDGNVAGNLFKKDIIQSVLFEEKYFVLVQFATLPSPEIQQQLKQAGVELSAYISGNAYLAAIKNTFDFTLVQKFKIRSVNIMPAAYKIDEALNNYTGSLNKDVGRMIAVSYYPSFNKEKVKIALIALGASVISTKLDAANIVFIEATKAVINKVALLPFVSSVSLQIIKDQVLNNNDIAAHGVSGLNAIGGKNLNGKGVAIGIGDEGDISTHIDFSGRLLLRTAAMPSSHSTHVSGTAAGAGILNIKAHGMAPKATIINQYFSDIITNAPTYITDNNMVVTNNSYHSVEGGCAGEGAYDVLSNYADAQIKNNAQLLHVFAAGNDGALTCSPYPASYGTVKSGWQSAKNVLTVGAMNTADYSIASFSSRGPVADGRIKPEITSGGVTISSTTLNNTYGYSNGTSMASPVITGVLALIYERYRQTHAGADPTSSLMKAIICNTALDLGNAGPDYSFGFGMVNARKAVEAIDSSRYFTGNIANAANASNTITLLKNARRLKVMLYWADKEAAVNAANTLVNDLDLSVTEPSSTLHRPMVLNPSNVTANAAEAIDHKNNIEQVVIENPVAGTYTINVNGFSIPFGPQNYSLSYEVLDSSVTVEYPFGGETFVPGETEIIRWTAYGSENNTFTIEYSTDNGNNWTTINSNVPAANRSYSWVVPAGLPVNQWLIRVKRNGTSLAGTSNFNFIVLGQPTVIASNVCEGYVKLNWAGIANATSYDVMKLTADSMQVIANITDTFFLVKGLNKNQVYWFGISAKNSSAAGRRSVSVSVLPGGGACTLPDFDNDVKIDTILEPATARLFFANANNAVKPVKVRIKNIGSIVATGPFIVSYSCAGGTATETFNGSIPAGGTIDYIFTTPYTTNPAGFNYTFKSWITNALDSNHENDSAYKVVKLLANAIITSLPLTEGFESTVVAEYTANTMGLDGDDRLDFSSGTLRGRARTFVNTGYALSGNRAITLDQAPASTSLNTDSLTVSYNLYSYTASQLRYDFYYKNHGQTTSGANKVWIRGSENDAWLVAYDLFANQAGLGLWKHANFNINDILTSATPAQTVSSTFQVKFGEQGLTSANSPAPVTDVDDGYTFDNLTITEAFNDVAITKIISPDKGGCALSAAT